MQIHTSSSKKGHIFLIEYNLEDKFQNFVKKNYVGEMQVSAF